MKVGIFHIPISVESYPHHTDQLFFRKKNRNVLNERWLFKLAESQPDFQQQYQPHL